MKKALIYLLYASILLGLWSAAGAFGKRTKEAAQPIYHPVVEESFPGPWTALSFVGDRPAFLATGQSLLFLGDSGETTKHVERTNNIRVIQSKKGAFVGIQELSSPSEKPESPRSLSFTLYDGQGSKLWTERYSLGDDDPIPSFYLSDLGRTAMVEPLEGIVSFYERDGSLARGFQLFPEAMAETERPVACAFSSDGRFFAVNALHHHARPGGELSPREKGQSYLMMFDSLGQEMWRRELAQEVSDRVELSSQGQVIAAGGYSVKGFDVVERSTPLYNNEGDLLAKLNFPFRHAAFSSDGQLLLLGHKNSLHLVETPTGQVLWHKLLPTDAGQIRALDLSPDGNLALVELARGSYQASRFIYTWPQVHLYDHQGQQIWQEDFPQDSFLQPLAKFQEDGSSILLAFQNRYLIYAADE